MNILVADDDRVVLQSCKRVLEAEGHTVSLAMDASEALEIMSRCAVDLALVDVVMPQYNGTYLVGEIRSRWPDMPVLLMSGYPTPETIEGGMRAGATAFLAKPFTPYELLEGVQKALEKD
jgi:DNA-binding NtrC family response regulator